MSNRFFFDDDSDTASTTSDLSSLPYPKPLKRSDFLTPSFSPPAYLSALQQNRHQTLEDLRTELRTRSQELNKELLDLVNDNYQDFLSLGRSLKGGDEKVEEVRVGLLGFQREVAALEEKVGGRRREVEGLVEERRRVREGVRFGRGLLELERRMGGLEVRLMVVAPTRPVLAEAKGEGEEGEGGEGVEDGVDDDDSLDDYSGGEEEEEDDSVVPLKRLRRRAEQYVLVRRLAEKLGEEHPFVAAREERREKLRATLLLDMGVAMRRAVETDGMGGEKELYMLKTYEMMGAQEECVAALKQAKAGLKRE